MGDVQSYPGCARSMHQMPPRKSQLPLAQVAALPVHHTDDGFTEVLLVTTRDTGRWVVPKGWPMPGKRDCDAAAIEAMEEAGAVGSVDEEPFGGFRYFKRRAGHFDLVEVTAYRLRVAELLRKWPEQSKRQRRWFKPDRAAELVQEPGLAALLLKIAAQD